MINSQNIFLLAQKQKQLNSTYYHGPTHKFPKDTNQSMFCGVFKNFFLQLPLTYNIISISGVKHSD